MNILLVGDEKDAAAIILSLRNISNHQITHCADSACAIAELVKKEFDLAILGGRIVSGRKRDVARLIRTMGTNSRESCHAKQTKTVIADQSFRSSCGVEWSKEGVLQLHCCMHEMTKRQLAPHRWLDFDTVVSFEYHAPCGKERRRNG